MILSSTARIQCAAKGAPLPRVLSVSATPIQTPPLLAFFPCRIKSIIDRSPVTYNPLLQVVVTGQNLISFASFNKTNCWRCSVARLHALLNISCYVILVQVEMPSDGTLCIFRIQVVNLLFSVIRFYLILLLFRVFRLSHCMVLLNKVLSNNVREYLVCTIRFSVQSLMFFSKTRVSLPGNPNIRVVSFQKHTCCLTLAAYYGMEKDSISLPGGRLFAYLIGTSCFLHRSLNQFNHALTMLISSSPRCLWLLYFCTYTSSV